MTDSRFAAVVLAAGFSRRMRCFKPLMQLGGETVADLLISTFAQNGVEVYLVVGHRKERLLSGLKNRGFAVVENPDFEKGMFSSVRAGLRSAAKNFRSIFIAPVDIPLVRPFTIRRLLSLALEQPGKILYPVFNRKRGHPPLLPPEIVPSILEHPETGNLKKALSPFENLAVEVNVPDRNILLDMDTRSDYKELLKSYQRYEVPTVEECETVLKDIYPVSDSLYRHSLKVAEIAGILGRALEGRVYHPDLELVHGAALLHDIAKEQPDHAAAGARRLEEMGFGRVGEITALHMDIPEKLPVPLEAKIVFLADKMVDGQNPVTVEERYRLAVKLHGTSPEARAAILQRRERALRVKLEIESLLGRPLESVPGIQDFR